MEVQFLIPCFSQILRAKIGRTLESVNAQLLRSIIYFSHIPHLKSVLELLWMFISVGLLLQLLLSEHGFLNSGNTRTSSFFMLAQLFMLLSSDDDELEEIDVQKRTLPQWATTFERSSDYGRRSNSSRGSNSSNLSSSSVYNHSQIKPHTLPVSSTNALSHRIARRDEPSYHAQNGNTSQQQTVNSQISKSHGEDYEKMSSQQAFKRTLPSTLQPSATRALPSPLFVSDIRSSNLKDNPGSSHLHDAYKNHRQGVGPTMSGERGYIRDSLIRGHDEGHLLYQNSGNRILPPSLVLGKAITPHFAISSESAYHSGIGDERSAENDERLIYEAALQDISQPKTEYDLPAGVLSVSLLRHQKIALAWMLQRETKSLHCLGGILADDQGLGKTVSMISLILALRSLQTKSKTDNVHNHKTEALNLDDDDDNGGIDVEKHKNSVEADDLFPNTEPSCSTQAPGRKRPAAGTLVVCPASVMRQWARELDEKVGDEKLSVLVYHGGNRTKDHVELAKFDVVLTTYSIVTNEVPKQPLVGDDDIEDKNGERFGLSSEFTVKKRKKPINGSKKGKKGRKGIDSSREYGSGPLAKVGWFRVILDEAQTIKNHRTQVARACCSLRAKRRWCLSGTPIQNSIDDLYSYFRFLKYDPYAAYKSFYNTIKVPIARDTIHGYKKLQAVLKAIMLRRTKGTLLDGKPIINLPPKTIELTSVDFSIEERAFYTKLESDSRTQFKAYAAAGTVNQNYANILLMLLRLRQACDHPRLVKDFDSDPVGKDSVEMAKNLPRELLINLFTCLDATVSICNVCNDPPHDPVITMCGHVFCYECVQEYLSGDDNMCPAVNCKETIGDDLVYSKVTLKSCISDDGSTSSSSNSDLSDYSLVQRDDYISSKIKAVLEVLQSNCHMKISNSDLPNSGCCRDSPSSSIDLEFDDSDSEARVAKHTRKYSESTTEGPIKTIVFSQWTSMLDLVETSLCQFGILYRRLDGRMTLGARDKAVRDFNTEPEITVMLMSLKAGNLGLNMVAACHVILLDLWWNPTTEDQAIDRAHRIGQTRPVTVTRITIKDTVEDRILSLQEDKREMVASAFGEDHAGRSGTRLTVDDLKYLFMV